MNPQLPRDQYYSARPACHEPAPMLELVGKCLKIISLLDPSEGARLQLERGWADMQKLTSLVDVIYQLAEAQAQRRSELDQIESLLQRQENLNRTLIKKELEYREEHKALLSELSGERERCGKLSEYVNRLSEETKDKDLTILQVKNELKASLKERRILDDHKLEPATDGRLASYKSKELQSEEKNVLRLGHKRRHSEDLNRKMERNEGKKKGRRDKIEGPTKKKNLLTYALK